MEEDQFCMRIHGLKAPVDDGDSDEDCDSFDEKYAKLKPPAIPSDTIKKCSVVIYPEGWVLSRKVVKTERKLTRSWSEVVEVGPPSDKSDSITPECSIVIHPEGLVVLGKVVKTERKLTRSWSEVVEVGLPSHQSDSTTPACEIFRKNEVCDNPYRDISFLQYYAYYNNSLAFRNFKERFLNEDCVKFGRFGLSPSKGEKRRNRSYLLQLVHNYNIFQQLFKSEDIELQKIVDEEGDVQGLSKKNKKALETVAKDIPKIKKQSKNRKKKQRENSKGQCVAIGESNENQKKTRALKMEKMVTEFISDSTGVLNFDIEHHIDKKKTATTISTITITPIDKPVEEVLEEYYSEMKTFMDFIMSGEFSYSYRSFLNYYGYIDHDYSSFEEYYNFRNTFLNLNCSLTCDTQNTDYR